MLRQFLEPEVVRQVMDIVPPSMHGDYRMVWKLTPSGEFSISSAYSTVRQASNFSWLTTCAWHKALPIKISFFMLRLLVWKLSFVE